MPKRVRAKPPAATKSPAKESPELGLGQFREKPAEAGLSLSQLSDAFAQLLGQGDDPYATRSEADAEIDEHADAAEADSESQPEEPATEPAAVCETTPRSILEAMLFVGLPGSLPLNGQQVAGLMRGVRSAEIDDLVRDLNEQYKATACPYEIVGDAAGYRLALRAEFSSVRDRFVGRVRQARLSPAAIEVLAAVAYNEPLTGDEVSQLRGTPSGHILSHLVRRQLLRIERSEERPRTNRYFTTPRFLEMFNLASLEELPRGQDLDKL